MTELRKTNTGPLTEHEAKQLVNRAAKAFKSATRNWSECCQAVLEFFERDGEQVLHVNYLAAALDVSRQHVYRLRDCGRVIRQLPQETTPPEPLTQRACLALSKLADRPESMVDAYHDALEAAATSGKPVSGRFVEPAVRRYLAHESVALCDTNNDPDQARDPRYLLWQDVAATVESARSLCAPETVKEALTRADQECWTWWQEVQP